MIHAKSPTEEIFALLWKVYFQRISNNLTLCYDGGTNNSRTTALYCKLFQFS